MKHLITICFLLCAQTLVCAHGVYTDSVAATLPDSATIAATLPDSATIALIVTSTDSAYLEQMAQQRRLQAQRDSIRRRRSILEPTTADPFHVGYADSLRIDSAARAFPYSPMAIPMVYVPLRMSSEELVADDMSTKSFTVWKLYRGAQRYLTAHGAELYNGTYDPTLFVDAETVTVTEDPNYFEEKALVKDEVEDRENLRRLVRTRNSPWVKQATLMLQLTQNYVSKNWYAGGNSNFALLAIAQGFINYKSDKVSWENSGEWRAGVNTVVGDSLRDVNMNDDLLKLYTKFGYKLYEKLYYSMSAELQTHLFETWTDNTRELKTGPLTPVRFNMTAGLDYKPVKGLSIVFSPVAYKLVYALDTVYSQPTTYSIPKGRNILNEVGSSMRVEWKYKPLREIELDSKFYLYTNYRKVEIDLEVNCNFIINRYFSTRVSLHPRYDNTVILPDDERAKIQFKEFVSVGFSHKFH